jgi:hypothetical protein
MALRSGKKIFRRSWDAIPLPETVITRVNTLGRDQPSQLTFTDRHGCLVDNDLSVDDLILPDEAAQTPGLDVQLNEFECPHMDVQLNENEYPQMDMQPIDAPQIPGVDGGNTQPNDPPQIDALEPVTMQREAVESAQHLVPALSRSARTSNKRINQRHTPRPCLPQNTPTPQPNCRPRKC